jgi:NAD(P)-dependent dehydrogenase (short-subunit alcohol dehydrogenase family)
LEAFFEELATETGGKLDILVNNAYSGVGWWGKRKLLGKPFWEQGMELFDAVHTVGVRCRRSFVGSRVWVEVWWRCMRVWVEVWWRCMRAAYRSMKHSSQHTSRVAAATPHAWLLIQPPSSYA